MGSKIREILRGAISLALFAVFGLGALLLSPLMLVLAKPERCQPIVRAAWRLMAGLFVWTGLIRIDRGNLPDCRGTIVVANHPSLVDVLLLTVLMPRLISISKRAVRKNPFMGLVARAVSIPVGADALDAVAPYLAKGWNILVFPEGTRSPFLGTDPNFLGTVPSSSFRGTVPVNDRGTVPVSDLGTVPMSDHDIFAKSQAFHHFKRGAAQLALRTRAPVVCVGIGFSRRLLAKRQPVWDMGTVPVCVRFRADAPHVEREQPGESRHAAAIRITQAFEQRVRGLLA